MKIFVLSAAPHSSATKSIVRAGEKRKHEMIVKNPAFLYILISEKESGYDRIYSGEESDSTPIRLKAKEIDAIIPRIGNNLEYGAAVLEHLNNNLHIFSTQTAEGIKTAANKLISQQKFSQARLKTPQTIISDKVIHANWMFEKIGGLPAIAKGITGSQGNAVYPLNEEYQSNVFLANFYHSKNKLLLQKMIDGGAKDFRSIVIDGKVIVTMQRTAAKGEIRANLSQGGTGEKVDLSEEDQQICINAARACGLEVAGVDTMKDQDGKTFVIEVNGNYGYGIEKITGVDISTPLIEYCERNYKKGNQANRQTGENAAIITGQYLPKASAIWPEEDIPSDIPEDDPEEPEEVERFQNVTSEEMTFSEKMKALKNEFGI